MALLAGLLAMVVIFWESPRSADPGRPQAESPSTPDAHPATGSPALRGHPAPASGARTTAAANGLSGIVRDARTREPIAGAVVIPGTPEVMRATTIDLRGHARSGEDGTFHLEVGAAHVPLRIYVHARGYRLWDAVAEGDSPLQVLLDEGGEITGVVVDDAGLPLAGVGVLATYDENTIAWPSSEVLLDPEHGSGSSAVSDEQGRFTIAGLDPDTTYTIRAGAGTYCFLDENVHPVRMTARPGDAIRIVLRPIYGMRLRVVDAISSTPIWSEVRMTGVALHEWFDVRSLPGRQERRVPDDLPPDRVLQFARMPGTDPGARPELLITAMAPGYRTEQRRARLLPGGQPLVTIALSREADVEWGNLAVTASVRGGEPFTGVLTLVVSGSGWTSARQLRFRDGVAAEHVEIPGGRVRALLLAGDDRSTRWWGQPVPGDPYEISASPGSTTPLDFHLAGSEVRLEVVDSAGRDVRGYGLAVQALPDGQDWPDHYWDQVVDASPDAPALPEAILWLSPGSYAIRILHPGYAPTAVDVEVANGVERRVRIVLGDRRPR